MWYVCVHARTHKYAACICMYLNTSCQKINLLTSTLPMTFPCFWFKVSIFQIFLGPTLYNFFYSQDYLIAIIQSFYPFLSFNFVCSDSSLGCLNSSHSPFKTFLFIWQIHQHPFIGFSYSSAVKHPLFVSPKGSFSLSLSICPFPNVLACICQAFLKKPRLMAIVTSGGSSFHKCILNWASVLGFNSSGMWLGVKHHKQRRMIVSFF